MRDGNGCRLLRRFDVEGTGVLKRAELAEGFEIEGDEGDDEDGSDAAEHDGRDGAVHGAECGGEQPGGEARPEAADRVGGADEDVADGGDAAAPAFGRGT